MKLIRRMTNVIAKTETGKRLLTDRRYRIVFAATISLILNLSYAVCHGVVGMMKRSWWFSALWAYYTILSITKFSAVLCERRNYAVLSDNTEYFVMRVSGILLLLLSCVLAGVNYMSLRKNIATKYGKIVMITIAAYTFGKLATTIVRVVKERGNPSVLLAVIRRIGYAEAAVSVLTLQRSMIVSFGEMDDDTGCLMNILTGTGVYLLIFFLGIVMIKEGRGKKYGKIRNSKSK